MLITRLREATANSHKKLEQKLFPFIQNIETIEEYAVLLNRFYRFVKPVQDKIHQYINPAIVPDLPLRRNAALLLEDLKALGTATTETTATALPAINDHFSAMGALYVLEGSTLGGKIIAKTLAEKLGNDVSLLFFRGYGAETGSMWKKFTHYLEHPTHLQQPDVVLRAATETFELFGACFNKPFYIKNP